MIYSLCNVKKGMSYSASFSYKFLNTKVLRLDDVIPYSLVAWYCCFGASAASVFRDVARGFEILVMNWTSKVLHLEHCFVWC
jgi:hypothetical protein